MLDLSGQPAAGQPTAAAPRGVGGAAVVAAGSVVAGIDGIAVCSNAIPRHHSIYAADGAGGEVAVTLASLLVVVDAGVEQLLLWWRWRQ